MSASASHRRYCANKNTEEGFQVEKRILEQIVRKRPHAVIGDIWLGRLPGYEWTISLRLARRFDDFIQKSGQVVDIPSPGASKTSIEVRQIELGLFREMIEKDGFGKIIWNVTKEAAFVTIELKDPGLVASFLQGAGSD